MSKVFWKQKQDIGPAARYGHAMAFDSARGCTVLFGGYSGSSATNDTWEWDGNLWTQVQDMGPAPRVNASMAFDPVRGRAVLFGGAAAQGPSFSDTWEWDGSNWTQIQDTGPSARAGQAMTFDSNAQLTLLFGGAASAGNTGDTWTWDGSNWTQVEDTGPRPRSQHSLAFSADRERTVLFGGFAASGVLGDTWEWDGTKWKAIQDIGPSARGGATMAFTGGSVVLFGGFDGDVTSGAKLFGDTWEWDGARWTERQDIGPQARWQHAIVCDATRNSLVLFGGMSTPVGQTPLGDTWELALAPLATIDALTVSLAGEGAVLQGLVTTSASAPPDGLVIGINVDHQEPITTLSASVVMPDGSIANLPDVAGPPWDLPVPAGGGSITFRLNALAWGHEPEMTFTATLRGVVTKAASISI